MLLEFENDSGFRHKIGEPSSFEETVKMIREYLRRTAYSVPYWEWIQEENLWILDFGSYQSAIFLTDLNENLIEEFNSFYERSN